MGNLLYLSFDAGSSLTKIIYGWIKADGKLFVKYLVMTPECLGLTAASASFLSDESGISLGLPEDNAWIRYSQNGDIFLLARMAVEYRARTHLKPLKLKTIVPKILGAIGAIAEKENLGEEIELVLGVLLPFNEINSKQELNNNLITRLDNFYFRDKKITVKLKKLKIVPEATGLAASYSIKHKKDFKQTNQSFLMLGHRNTSFLVFERGSFSRSKSSVTTSGFYDFIDIFREKVPGVEREDFLNMLETTAKINYDWQKKVFELENQTFNYDFVKLHDTGKSLDYLKNALKVSLNEYWSSSISSWMKGCLQPNIDVLWVCGGAAPFILPDIENEFSNIKIHRPRLEISDLILALGFKQYDCPTELIEQNLIERMLDVWGLFAASSNYYARQEVSA